jgi:hypothetical protein
MPSDDVLEDGMLERHGDAVLGLELDGGGELLGVLDRREVDGAHDDALVGHAEPDALGELVVAEEAAQRGGVAFDVGDLAVADHARLERRGGRALDHEGAAGGAGFDRGHQAGLDVEAHDGAA